MAVATGDNTRIGRTRCGFHNVSSILYCRCWRHLDFFLALFHVFRGLYFFHKVLNIKALNSHIFLKLVVMKSSIAVVKLWFSFCGRAHCDLHYKLYLLCRTAKEKTILDVLFQGIPPLWCLLCTELVLRTLYSVPTIFYIDIFTHYIYLKWGQFTSQHVHKITILQFKHSAPAQSLVVGKRIASKLFYLYPSGFNNIISWPQTKPSGQHPFVWRVLGDSCYPNECETAT